MAGRAGIVPGGRATRVVLRGRSRSGGFTLIVVVWGLGLITVLGTMAIVGARYRARDVSGLTAIAQAGADAESAVGLGILRAMDAEQPFRRPLLFRCTLPDRSSIRVSLEREAGKVDLNAASLPLLSRLFTGLTHDSARGQALAQAIVAYRTKGDRAVEPDVTAAYLADGKPDGPKRAPFLTVLELDQVVGASSDLIAAALPFLTVVADRPAPDPDVAAPALLTLLGLPPAEPGRASAADAPAAGGHEAPPGAVTIRVEARTAAGAVAVREALVKFGAAGAPYTIVEWRRGMSTPDDGRSPPSGDTGACLR